MTTSARTPSAALPSNSAVVIPASSCAGFRVDCISSPSAVAENDRGQRGGDEQQHDGSENRDRRDQHGGATANSFFVELFTARVANVFTQREQSACEIDAALDPRRQQLIRASRARLRCEFGRMPERFALG